MVKAMEISLITMTRGKKVKEAQQLAAKHCFVRVKQERGDQKNLNCRCEDVQILGPRAKFWCSIGLGWLTLARVWHEVWDFAIKII